MRGEGYEYSTNGPICPWCEHRNDPSDHYDEGTDEITCDECEEKFQVRVYIQHSWTTWKQGEEP